MPTASTEKFVVDTTYIQLDILFSDKFAIIEYQACNKFLKASQIFAKMIHLWLILVNHNTI